jgi:undecaprenyl diphosphate synthase
MKPEQLPQHIGIIMDGNGRWAKLRGLPRTAGHKAGAKIFKKIMTHCGELGIGYVTVYAFSTENWKRSPEEVNALMNLFMEYMEDAKNYYKDNIQIHIIGDRTPFSQEMKERMARCESDTAAATGMHLNVALNYGGQHELTQAMQQIAAEVKAGTLQPEEINEKTVEDHLYTKGQPPVDLIIRPSGEYRLSNFLIWQAAYAEFVFMDTLWPDFSAKELDKALAVYAKRSRRFGAEAPKAETEGKA